MQTFTIENTELDSLIIIIEPYHEVIEMKKDDWLELKQSANSEGYYVQSVFEGGHLVLTVEGEYEVPEIFINGKEH